MLSEPQDVLTFWADAGPKMWYKKDAGFDAEIDRGFRATLDAAVAGKLENWRDNPDGTLALIIVLDQFSRNLFRDDARAFAQDEQCREVVNQCMDKGFDRKMREDLVPFCYMPLMHSEALEDQEKCLTEMQRLGLDDAAKYARIHLDIIEEFGRFPHRNAALGRSTTAAEQKFLENGGFSG